MSGHERCFVAKTQWSHAHWALVHTAKLGIVVDRASPGLPASGVHRTRPRTTSNERHAVSDRHVGVLWNRRSRAVGASLLRVVLGHPQGRRIGAILSGWSGPSMRRRSGGCDLARQRRRRPSRSRASWGRKRFVLDRPPPATPARRAERDRCGTGASSRCLRVRRCDSARRTGRTCRIVL